MNETKPSGNRRGSGQQFDETFKQHAVELILRGGRRIRDLAQELGITEWTLYRWRQRYAPKPGGTAIGELSESQKDEEIRRLRAEVCRMQEREIVLKKSLGILSETPERGMPGSKR